MGSEMCIRDRFWPLARGGGSLTQQRHEAEQRMRTWNAAASLASNRQARHSPGAAFPCRPEVLMQTYACAAKLDRLNFFLADVRDGLGPYLAIYLLSVHKWQAGDIGLVMALGGLAGLAAQIPAGALVDWVRDKRLLIVIASVLVPSPAWSPSGMPSSPGWR